jgi:hypothetical protein
MHPRVVSVAPIRSQSKNDEAALSLARQLSGVWRAEDFVLHIDAERAQANMNLNAPFEWQRFLVKRIYGNTVAFSLGAELFQARLSDEGVILTGTTLRGERNLTAVR